MLLDEQEKVYMPTAVLGEYYLGAYPSATMQKKLKKIRNFLEKYIVLFADATTADKYAIIYTPLVDKGKTLSRKYKWIVATAMHYQQ